MAWPAFIMAARARDGASDGEVVFGDDGVDPVKSALHELNEAFSALGDDPDYLAEVVTQAAGAAVGERLRDLFQAVGAVLDRAHPLGLADPLGRANPLQRPDPDDVQSL